MLLLNLVAYTLSRTKVYAFLYFKTIIGRIVILILESDQYLSKCHLEYRAVMRVSLSISNGERCI